MPAHKKSASKKSKAEAALVTYFLEGEKHFVSFKQLKKKFGSRFHKGDLYDAVHNLVDIGFLEERSNQFRHHEEQAQLEVPRTGVKPGSRDIIEGVIDITQRGHAYVVSEQSKNDVWIEKRNVLNALDGDTVKVLLTRKNAKKPEGKVVEVVKRAKDSFVGVIQQTGRQYFLKADSRTLAVDFFIPEEKRKNARHGDKVVVKLVKWDVGMRQPQGEVIEVLGEVGENETEMQAILIENGFRMQFPQRVLQEAENLPSEISEEEIKRRRDFRRTLTFTIDPADAKDFDDAISFKMLEDGWYEIGVHIADVSHYIRPNAVLDKEALQRGTSVYLVDRTVPMLPEKLSNGICSLTPESDKLCFAAVFVMNENAEIKNRWFGKTIIHSNKRFAYEDAQEIIEGKEDKFSVPLLALNRIAKQLREMRFRNGSIDFNSVEVKFKLDEKGNPLSAFLKVPKDANMLIEDFMLLANKSVAEFVGKRKGKEIPFVYRVHDLPDDEKLKDFADFAAMFGYKLNFSTPKHTAHSINKMMEKLKGKPEEYMLETLAIRTMAKAVYTTKNIGHYGLAFDFYTHFTSPIRRYPDVMVHRILEKVLNGEPVRDENYEAKCLHSSEMERKAADAERASVKLKQVEFMEKQIGKIFNGIISGVTDFGIFVITEDSYCEGLVRLDSIKSDYFVFEEKKYSVRGTNTDRKYRLGDKVKVKLVDTNLDRRTIDFEMVESARR
ncbi:MAG TPA: ribonuclease R [Chitinophagales bacterium]|nr:ribonuclease R [Chitinophagales bacterium]